jgi:hypothetical protein
MNSFDRAWDFVKANPNWNRRLIEEEIHGVAAKKPTKGNCPVCHGFFDVDLPHPDACKCDECPKCGLDMASTASNQCRCD